MIEYLKKLFNISALYSRLAHKESLLNRQIAQVEELTRLCDKKLSDCDVVYTTVQTFGSDAGDTVFWPWAKQLLTAPEYKYLLFSLRENIIRELVTMTEPNQIIETNGKLKMLQIFDLYLTQGLTQYDNEQKNKILGRT